MDSNEKRRLKKLGKQAVAARSRELQERLRKANPAPIGSDTWAMNYREASLKEKTLRLNPRDRLPAAELAQSFVPNPTHEDVPKELFGVRGWFWECLACGDAVYSLPSTAVRCECGNIAVDPGTRVRSFDKPDRVRCVTLIGRGANSVPRVPIWSVAMKLIKAAYRLVRSFLLN